MERSKIIISICVGFASLFIIWRVGIYPPVPEQVEKPGETKVVGEAAKPNVVQQPSDANRPVVASDVNVPKDANEPRGFADAGGRRGLRGRPGQTEGGDLRRAGRVTDVNDANEPMENLNLKDVKMSDIIKKLAEWTGKTVIPHDEAMKQKLTVYAPNPLPRNKALQQVYSALRMKGYIIEHMDDTIYIKPIAEGKFGLVPTIPSDQPLAMIEDKNQMAQRFFKLANYNPSQMGQVIQPLVSEYGYVSADETTSSVLVVDTVANLIRIERIILELDVSQAEKMEQEVFEILYGNPEEIVQLLQVLVGDGSGSTTQGRGGGPSRGSQRSSRSGGSSGATSVTVGSGQAQVTLIADTKNSLIIAKASSENMEQIRQWIKKLDKSVPTITADYPLTAIENKNQMMQYFFKLQNYSPTQMAQVVTPLLSENGYVSADESTRQLLVGDTVKNLIDIERVVKQFDVPEAEQTVQDIFEIRNGDPGEIVQLLRMLLGDTSTSGTSSRSLTRGSSYGSSSSRTSSRSFTGGAGGSRSGSSSSVLIGPSQSPVILIPVPNRKWIIARASAEDMKRIEEWIDKLDVQEEITKEYESIPITYVDATEVAERINEALEQMPGTELRASVLVQPLAQARQIMVFGRQDLREMVRALVAEVDRPPGQFITEHFKLKYADPDQIKTNIEELYAQTTQSSRYSYTFYYGSSRSTTSSDTVKVISYISLKQVTVIASPENMDKIREQIKEWDAPLDINEVKPRIIELYNSDPVEMTNLLKTLFSEESAQGVSYWDYWYGSSGEDKQKIVGPLYGQLTFEEVPSTKKIIIISKIPEAYDIVEALIRDLDSQQMAEVPRIVQIKYADPEDLSERLNAMFNEPGTSARIRYTAQGLGTYSMDQQASSNQSSSGSQSGGGGTSSSGDSTDQSTTGGTYTPWWSGSGARSTTTDQLPISNVIGRIRFVPDPHSKSILVLAPPGYIDRIEELIKQLDIPGKQVMIKAVIIEVDHKSMTSLGLQLASNSSAFGTLGENSLTLGSGTAGNVLQFLEKHGALVFGAGGDQGTSISLDVAMDVTALIDFLVKKVNAKILNQQTLWTKDNEEASFFKGDKVAFSTSAQQATVPGGTGVQNFEFQRVGMTLAARPSITPEKKVDMVINIILSQLTGDLVNSQPARTEMETKTNMIVQDGQTIMLGGILFQKDSVIKRKVPLLGDIPLAGGLFRHTETLLANNELIVFITPYVIDEPGEMLPETTEEIEAPKRKLDSIRGDLKDRVEKLKEELQKDMDD